jgi:hypothetical protein
VRERERDRDSFPILIYRMFTKDMLIYGIRTPVKLDFWNSSGPATRSTHSCTMGTGTLSLGKNGRHVMLTTYHLLSSGSRMNNRLGLNRVQLPYQVKRNTKLADVSVLDVLLCFMKLSYIRKGM